MFHCRPLAIVTSLFCDVKESSPLGNSNAYSKKYSKVRNSWKTALYLNLFHYIRYQVQGVTKLTNFYRGYGLVSFRKLPEANTHADWFKTVFLFKLHRNTELARTVDVMMARTNRIYILMIEVNKLFSFFFVAVFSKRNRKYLLRVPIEL